MNLDKITEMMFEIPWPPQNRPDPMSVPFKQLEARIETIVDEFWKIKNQLELQSLQLHPIWKVSLRMNVMYLNMSEAFYACGKEFTEEALNESKFIEIHQNSEGRSERDRASRLLARTVKLLRVLGFKSPLISIGGDSHYYGACAETISLLNELRTSG